MRMHKKPPIFSGDRVKGNNRDRRGMVIIGRCMLNDNATARAFQLLFAMQNIQGRNDFDFDQCNCWPDIGRWVHSSCAEVVIQQMLQSLVHFAR